MNEEKYIGKTLREVAILSGQNPKGYVVFALRDAQDDTGRRIGDDLHIRHLINRFPYIANYTVKIAYDYYGQTILRVLAGGGKNDA